MGKVILFASGKGGVGKTTITAGVGFAFAQSGKKVLLLDADLRLRNLDLVLGAQDKAIFDVQDIFYGRCEEERAILASNTHPGLFFLSAPLELTASSGDIFSFILKFALEKSKKYDYVLIDCPAGLGEDMENLFTRKVKLVCVATAPAAR